MLSQVGLDFKSIPFLFEDAIVLGIYTKRGQTILCPENDVRYCGDASLGSLWRSLPISELCID